jgi:hypothetical protein
MNVGVRVSVAGRGQSLHSERQGRWRVLPGTQPGDIVMGRSILLWLLGVPIPVIILIALFWR